MARSRFTNSVGDQSGYNASQDQRSKRKKRRELATEPHSRCYPVSLALTGKGRLAVVLIADSQDSPRVPGIGPHSRPQTPFLGFKATPLEYRYTQDVIGFGEGNTPVDWVCEKEGDTSKYQFQSMYYF